MQRVGLLVGTTLLLVCSALFLLYFPNPARAATMVAASAMAGQTSTPPSQPTVAPQPTRVPPTNPCDLAPKAPPLVSPAKRAMHVPTTIVLKWHKVPCKPTYWLEVRSASQNGPTVLLRALKQKAFVATLARGFFAWRVTACTHSGCNASEWRKFRLGPTPEPPVPTPRPTATPYPTQPPSATLAPPPTWTPALSP